MGEGGLFYIKPGHIHCSTRKVPLVVKKFPKDIIFVYYNMSRKYIQGKTNSKENKYGNNHNKIGIEL